jgi:hypothetical protein
MKVFDISYLQFFKEQIFRDVEEENEEQVNKISYWWLRAGERRGCISRL